MTLIRTILAWIAVTAVVTVMAPIVMLVNVIFIVIAAPSPDSSSAPMRSRRESPREAVTSG